MQDTSAPIQLSLPKLTGWPLAFSALSIMVASLLLGLLAVRIVIRVDLWQWWPPLVFLGGVAAADFASGLVHWSADTWGRNDCPVLGRRLLVPFRVHHLNPDDFLRRSFIDTNGDVALVTIPVLLMLLALPPDSPWGSPVAVFGLAFCGIGSLTNQIHQWSHMQAPPRLVKVLQSCGLLLGRDVHGAHHQRPYDHHYCITTGWCNQPLEAIGFFRRLEAVVTRLTGAAPRHDDRRYEMESASTLEWGRLVDERAASTRRRGRSFQTTRDAHAPDTLAAHSGRRQGCPDHHPIRSCRPAHKGDPR